jgi:hypothetical protein
MTLKDIIMLAEDDGLTSSSDPGGSSFRASTALASASEYSSTPLARRICGTR